MYKQCKTLKSRDRQKEFEQTLLRMMEKQLFKEITVSALCREMGAPRKAFYRYFDSMEDVLNALTDEVIVEASLHVDGQIELERFFEYWRKETAFLDVLQKNGLSQKMMERCFSMVLADECLDMNSVNAMKRAGYISAMLTLVTMWHHNGMKQSVGEMKNLVLQMFVNESKKEDENVRK